MRGAIKYCRLGLPSSLEPDESAELPPLVESKSAETNCLQEMTENRKWFKRCNVYNGGASAVLCVLKSAGALG